MTSESVPLVMREFRDRLQNATHPRIAQTEKKLDFAKTAREELNPIAGWVRRRDDDASHIKYHTHIH